MFGELGRLDSDGERVQCHICGGWFDLLGSHVYQAHGMRRDEYRAAFGLKRRTKLASERYRQVRRALDAERLKEMSAPHKERFRAATFEQRQEWSRRHVVRREHERTRPEPERTEQALRSRWGSPQGLPKEVYEQAAREFVAELGNGQRGVYGRLARRWDISLHGARRRVARAVELGILEWTGRPHEPQAALPGEGPAAASDWDRGFAHLTDYVATHGHARVPSGWRSADGFKLGSWVQSQRERYRRRNLSAARIDQLKSQPGWVWRSKRGKAQKGTRSAEQPRR